MNKIGIITYHFNNNYGTMLQALALQHKIELLGYQSEIINYRFKDMVKDDKKSIFIIRCKRMGEYLFNLKKYIYKFKLINSEKSRNIKFKEFYEKNMVLSNREYLTLEDLKNKPPIYDIYIVGSDQTWNPYVGNLPEAFFLSFVPKNKIRMSYAPSIAVNKIEKEKCLEMKKLLENVEFLSCRENEGSQLLEKITKRKVKNVLDPTLLLTEEEWKEFMSKKSIKGPYILQYFLGDEKQCRQYVEKISKETGLPTICLPHNYLDMQYKSYKKFDVGPAEFIRLIKEAEYVCTDSYHGTLFSINFNKEFYSFCKFKPEDKKSENSRLEDILKKLGLENRLIKNFSVLELNKKINYKEINKKLEILKKDSLNYLESKLSKEVG